MYRVRAPKTNKEAIRSGDYYMFDELDDDDVTDMIPDTESEKREAEKQRELEQRGRRMTISEAADVTSVETEEKDVEEREKTPEVEEDKKDEEEIPMKEERISIATYFNFLIVIINSTFISMTRYLNRFSRDYRYIRKVLTKEKKLLKAKPDLQMGIRLGINKMWQPMNFLKKE